MPTTNFWHKPLSPTQLQYGTYTVFTLFFVISILIKSIDAVSVTLTALLTVCLMMNQINLYPQRYKRYLSDTGHMLANIIVWMIIFAPI